MTWTLVLLCDGSGHVLERLEGVSSEEDEADEEGEETRDRRRR